MDMTEIARRLDAQERVLHAILAALAPPETEGQSSGFDDLVETLADLTVSVSDAVHAVSALRSDVSRLSARHGGTVYVAA